MGVLQQNVVTSTGGSSTVPIMPDYLAQAIERIASGEADAAE